MCCLGPTARQATLPRWVTCNYRPLGATAQPFLALLEGPHMEALSSILPLQPINKAAATAAAVSGRPLYPFRSLTCSPSICASALNPTSIWTVAYTPVSSPDVRAIHLLKLLRTYIAWCATRNVHLTRHLHPELPFCHVPRLVACMVSLGCL